MGRRSIREEVEDNNKRRSEEELKLGAQLPPLCLWSIKGAKGPYVSGPWGGVGWGG
jgi:hypothetical protein